MIRIDTFGGVAPKIERTSLADSQASEALNARLDNGTVRYFCETVPDSAFPYASGVTPFTPTDMYRVSVGTNKTWLLWEQNDPVYVLGQTPLVDSRYIPPSLTIPPLIPSNSWSVTYAWAATSGYVVSQVGNNLLIEHTVETFTPPGGPPMPFGPVLANFPIVTIGAAMAVIPPMQYTLAVESKTLSGAENVKLNDPDTGVLITMVIDSANGTLPVTSVGMDNILDTAAPARIRAGVTTWIEQDLVPWGDGLLHNIGSAEIVLRVTQSPDGGATSQFGLITLRTSYHHRMVPA